MHMIKPGAPIGALLIAAVGSASAAPMAKPAEPPGSLNRSPETLASTKVLVVSPVRVSLDLIESMTDCGLFVAKGLKVRLLMAAVILSNRK